MTFDDTLRRLEAGDFSALAPLFAEGPGGSPSAIVSWLDQGLFAPRPAALAEAFTCACFLGAEAVVENLLARGCLPAGGAATGADALHWAANRGELGVVRLLLEHGADTESRNRFGGTALGMAVWSAVHEPRAEHLRIIEALVAAGAEAAGAGYPTGDARVDAFLALLLPAR